MFIYIILFLFIVLFTTKFGSKKGFDKLETYWIIYTIIFYIIFFKLTPLYQILFLTLIIKTNLFLIILTLTGVLLSIIGNKFKNIRMTSLILYNNYLNLNMNIENIPNKPTIFMANYPSNYIEYLTHGLFGEKICLVVHGAGAKILNYIYGTDHLIPVNKNSFNSVQKEVENKMKNGYHIFCYVERDYYNRKDEFDTCDFRSGMFTIAKNLNSTITPVCIDHIRHSIGIVENNVFNIKIGNTSNVKDVNESISEVKNFFKSKLKKMKIPKII